MTVPTWATKTPADMSESELKAAVAWASEYLTQTQTVAAQAALVHQHLYAEVSSRFGVTIPGIPHPTALPEYPTSVVSDKFTA